MPKIVRSNFAARLWLKRLSDQGAVTLPPDGIAVKGHCVGAVGRAFTNGPAGYWDAHAMINAVARAGKLKAGRPAVGGIPMWRGGKHGHVAVQSWKDTIWTVDQPVDGRIGRVKRSEIQDRWGYVYVGWCYSWDIPGWKK